MKNLISVIFAVVFATPTQATQQDTLHCTLDYRHYEAKARELAASKPGGRLDNSTHEVSWDDAHFGRVSVLIGGCNHFGLMVRAEIRSSRNLTHAQVVEYATRLVSEQWPSSHAKTIVPRLSKLARNNADPGNNSFVSYDVPGYDEVSLTYSFQKGTMKIEVSAIQTT